MNVLSLFDGLSGAQLALQKLGCKPKYFASEIDEYAMKITKKNFPKTIQLGDVRNWRKWKLPKIDLLVGGSPCQDLSVANNNAKGLEGSRSSLFWEYVDILNALNPRYFVLENVESMKTKDYVIISNTLGVSPIMLDAGLVSAQRRKRYFWTNIPNVKKPKLIPSRLFPDNKKGLVIADILEPNATRKILNIDKQKIIRTSYGVRWNRTKQGVERQSSQNVSEKDFSLTASMYKTLPMINNQPQGQNAQMVKEKDFSLTSQHAARMFIVNSSQPQGMSAQWTTEKSFSVVATNPKSKMLIVDHNSQQNRAFKTNGKHGVLPASRMTSKTIFVFDDLQIEQLTWTELERLAGLPDGYSDLGEENKTEGRGRSIGNGFQIDIVAHLFSFMLGNPTPLERSKKIVKAEQMNLF
jgi:DNA (cytosine-5)-methyltransferase 3A